MTDTRERLCLFCTELRWDEGERGWSTLTPGSTASIECEKHVWDMCLNEVTLEEFRETILTAGTCKHYHCVTWDKKDGITP